MSWSISELHLVVNLSIFHIQINIQVVVLFSVRQHETGINSSRYKVGDFLIKFRTKIDYSGYYSWVVVGFSTCKHQNLWSLASALSLHNSLTSNENVVISIRCDFCINHLFYSRTALLSDYRTIYTGCVPAEITSFWRINFTNN